MPPKQKTKSDSDSDSSNEKRFKEIGNTNINIEELSQELDDLQVNNNVLIGPYGRLRISTNNLSNKRGPPTLSSLSSNDNMSSIGTPTSIGTPRSIDSNKAYVPKNKKIKKDPFKFNIDLLNTGRKDALEQKIVGVEPELNLVSPSVSPQHTSQIAFHPGSATKKNRKSKKEKKKPKKGGKTKKSKKKNK